MQIVTVLAAGTIMHSTTASRTCALTRTSIPELRPTIKMFVLAHQKRLT